MRTIRSIAVIFAIGLVASACGGNDDDLGSLVPFAEVQDSAFVFEADPFAPDRGIFRVTTTEPMICTIVWGETDAFGNFNNSLEMNGTGIIDHNVSLPGAEPGKEYVFRVQGSTADGRQFRSEQGTFVIPESADQPADDGAAPAGRGPNVALDATVVEVSSEFSTSWSGANAIDGDETTEWATSGDGDDGYLVIDLGASTDVSGIEFITRSMADGSAVTEEYTVTPDDAETFGPFPAGNLGDARYAEASFTGQVIRFDVAASTGGNVGAVEVRVFAAG